MPKWQVLSAMASTPLWLKWASTLLKFSRLIVISLTHISRKAENVANNPCRPGSDPNPAAALKLPRSMMPAWTNTSGCALWM